MLLFCSCNIFETECIYSCFVIKVRLGCFQGIYIDGAYLYIDIYI